MYSSTSYISSAEKIYEMQIGTFEISTDAGNSFTKQLMNSTKITVLMTLILPTKDVCMNKQVRIYSFSFFFNNNHCKVHQLDLKTSENFYGHEKKRNKINTLRTLSS